MCTEKCCWSRIVWLQRNRNCCNVVIKCISLITWVWFSFSMAANTFFKRQTPFERLQKQKKAKAENLSKSKQRYEESRVRTFDVDWKENRDWLEYVSLADLYFKNAESLKGVLLAVIQERTKSSDETLDVRVVSKML